MQPATLVLSLLVILSCRTVLAAFVFNTCTSGNSCIDIHQCDLFSPYYTEPKKWTNGQKDDFRKRICSKEQTTSGGSVYKVCCPTKRRIDLLDLQGCGPYTSDRIAFGETAKLFDYPWMALLRGNGQWICGGTLINTRYVLTAAHCVKDIKLDYVRLGEFDLDRPIDCDTRDDLCAAAPQDIPVERTIIHEDYSVRRKLNDIALLRLAHAATLNDNVIPICLPVTPELQTNLPTYFVAGWGLTENKTVSHKLLYTKLTYVPNNECQTQLRTVDRYTTLYDTQICAKGEKALSDNCSGDSGGPLKSVSLNARFVQYGVVSFGLRSCGKLSAPGVYTKVESYVDWILSKLED